MTAYRTDPACMLMSPTTSLARPINQCPYCEHVSPANSKFCNECGAALHLQPCPHCGAVNDVTLTSACARCNGTLNERTAVALIEPAASAPPERPARAMAAPDSLPRQEAAQRPTLAPGSSSSRRLLVLATLGLAGLGLYAFQQMRPPSQPTAQPTPRPEPPAATSVIPTVATPATPPLRADTAAPAEQATAPEPTQPETGARAQEATDPAAGASAALVASTPPAAGQPSTAPTVIARPRPNPAADSNANPYASSGARIEPPPPNIGPCTDAVAALGLCTPAPRRP
jgi:Double zinc ribbon